MSEETKDLIIVIAGYVVPGVLAPLVVMALRPLFAIFLREGLELFTDVTLESGLVSGIGRVIAKVNVLILLFAWWAAHTCYVVDGKQMLMPAIVAMCGVVLALVVTVQMVRNRVGVVGQPSMLVGLLTFAGGNLPIFLLVPILLVIR